MGENNCGGIVFLLFWTQKRASAGDTNLLRELLGGPYTNLSPFYDEGGRAPRDRLTYTKSALRVMSR
jgi:hypothetical protein